MSTSSSIKFMRHDEVVVGILRYSSLTEQRDLDVFASEVLRFLDERECIDLVLDLRKVRYFSSAMLGELVKISRAVRQKGGAFRLCHLSPQILEILEVTRLNDLLEIDSDLRTALRKLGSRKVGKLTENRGHR